MCKLGGIDKVNHMDDDDGILDAIYLDNVLMIQFEGQVCFLSKFEHSLEVLGSI